MKRIFSAFLLPCLWAASAFAQGSPFVSGGISVFGPTGRPLAGATVTICAAGAAGIPCSPTITVYSDAALTVPAANPQTSDGLGNVFVYLAPGNYTYTVTGVGVTGKSFTATSACIPTAAACLASGIGNPATPGNTVQKSNSNATAFAASGLTDDGTVLTVDRDMRAKGPNPYVDVTRYGVRALVSTVIPAISGITANTTSGSATVTVSTSSCPSQSGSVCFVNGDGVVIAGAGAANTVTTPAAPTVTPSNSQLGTGTNSTVAAPAGATTYNYKVFACDQAGGCSAASTAGSTTTGAVTLGAQSLSITSATRANDVLTFNTPSQPAFSVGAIVHTDGFSAADGGAGFTGWWRVSTVTATGFTVSGVGLDTRNGASTASAGGGTVNWWNANHVVWTTVTNAYRYVVQSDRQVPGTFANVGISWPVNGAFTGGTLTFDDFGQTMMANSVNAIPWYMPSNGLATNDNLVTTISSGAGTLTLTLAANAGATLTGATIRFDDAPNIASMVTALYSFGSGPPLYFSRDPANGTYVTNSLLDISAQSPTMLFSNSPFVFKDTVKTSGGRWHGDRLGLKSSGTSFQTQSNPQIAFGASPGLHVIDNTLGSYTGLNFTGASGGVAIIVDGGGGGLGSTWDQVSLNGATGAAEYMSMAFVCRSSTNSCPAMMGTVLVQAGAQSQVNTTFTPALYNDGTGEFVIDNLMGSARSLMFNTLAAGSQIRIGHAHWQGGPMPLVTIANNGGVSLALGDAGPVILDTMANASVFFANISNQTASAFCGDATFGCGNPSSGLLTFTGGALTNIVSVGAFSPSGQNKASVSLSSPSNFTDRSVQVLGAGGVGYQMPVPAAPTAAISAGGAVPIGTVNYKLTAVDLNGNETVTSAASATVTTTSGNQTVTVTPPAAPSGSTSYHVYRSAGGGGYARANDGNCGVGQGVAWGTNFVDTFGFGCGNSGPSANLALVSGISSSGVAGTNYALLNGGFKNSISGTFTANRTQTVQDVTDTFVYRATTDTLTNKTATGASNGNNITLLNAQANAAAITGTGAAVTLYTYTLPANTVATLKGIRVTAGYNHSTGTASVTYTLTLNGQTIASYSATATGPFVEQDTILNLTSTTGSRVSILPMAAGGGSTSTLTGLAWTSSQVLTLTFTVAATDAVTPIQWLVELIQ